MILCKRHGKIQAESLAQLVAADRLTDAQIAFATAISNCSLMRAHCQLRRFHSMVDRKVDDHTSAEIATVVE